MSNPENTLETPLKVFSPSFGQFLPLFISPIFLFTLYLLNLSLLWVSLAFWCFETIIFFFVWFSITFTKYRLFSNRVTVDVGFLNKSSRSIPFSAINNVSSESNLFQRPFNIGNIRIDSATGQSREVFLLGVSDPENISEMIFRLKEKK